MPDPKDHSKPTDDDAPLPMPEDANEGTAPLPMPDDSSAGTASGEEKVPMPEDTVEILTGRKEAAKAKPDAQTKPAPKPVPSLDAQASSGASRAGDTTGGGTNVDTIIGKLVVDTGLATNDDVEAMRKELMESGTEVNQRSLAQALVENEYITRRQLNRLRGQAEAERKSQQIPGYHVIGKVGAGAMAAVFKARQISLDRTVAIKVLPRKYSGNKQFIERFYAEGRAAAQLNHPNIVQAFDVGQAGDFHYFVMEYVEGRTVHDEIVERKRYTEEDALEIITNVADALKHAHLKGLIHRDVKPKNIIMTDAGIAKLADLGLARAIDDKEAALAEAGKAFGTPYYISPEQIRGEVNIGPQADIYSLGATLYHMVTGNVPFNGKNPTEVMQKHLKAPLIPPDHVNAKLSGGISEVVEMMMAKSRKQRYKNCEEILTDLAAIRRGETPPVAHKEATALDLAAVAAAQSTQPAEVVEARPDRTPLFEHPGAVVLMVTAIVFFALTVLFGVVAFAG
ncbi:MAG: serine/threonine-protein kinase [Planctomycetota bacterium]